MTSTSETGHAKNVANFQLLIAKVNALGAQYNPGNAAITLSALQAKYTEADAALTSHSTIKTGYDNATNAREILFQDINRYATRIINTLQAFGAAPQTVNDAKTVIRKLRGSRAPKKAKKHELNPTEENVGAVNPATPGVTEGGTERVPKTNSSSQRSFDLMRQHFGRLYEIVSAEPTYTPNEPDLSVVGLSSYFSNISTATAEVATHIANFEASATKRDHILYAPDTGLSDLVKDVKSYVKGIYGSTSAEYKNISDITIQKIRRR